MFLAGFGMVMEKMYLYFSGEGRLVLIGGAAFLDYTHCK